MMKCAAAPCVSCPYRQDVPSGLWDEAEYAKLVQYDGPTYDQPLKLFMCHTDNGDICAGWLACHDPHELLALRFKQERFDPSVFTYKTDVPIFASGQAAYDHGVEGIFERDPERLKMVEYIRRVRARNNEQDVVDGLD